MNNDTLENAYQSCLQMAQQHYENFPTASHLLTKPQRRATAAIYAFARSADDIADEGQLAPNARQTRLDTFATQLSQIRAGVVPTQSLFIALADTIARYELPFTPFEKLLQAFRSDIDTRRYKQFTDLAVYCDNSANPIGELMLRLHGAWNETNSLYSDRICTALQLINFIQDLDSDYHLRGRLYIPLEDLGRFQVSDSDFALRHDNANLKQLISYQLERACELLNGGQALLNHTQGRLRILLTLTLCSAQRMLTKLHARHSVFTRPHLQRRDYLFILMRSMIVRPIKCTC